MRKLLFIFLALQVIGGWPAANAFDQDEEIPWLALEGQKRIFERRYDDATELFRHVERDNPNAALGFFGQMAVLEARMLEREDFHLENEFMDIARRGEAVVGKVMQFYHPSDVDLFFCGGLVGLEGFFKARKGQWWGAYTKGNLSRQIFTSIKKRNPNFIDALFGLGMYDYWRSVFTNEIKFLPFFSDKRKEGIEMVERVAKEGLFARELARVNLGIIYLEERRYADAARVLEEYSGLYSQNVILHILLGRVLLADKKYDHAVEEFEKILVIDPEIAKAHYFVGTALALQGKKERFAEATDHLNGFLKIAKERLWRSYALYWLGLIHEKQGDNKGAAGYYTQAIELNRGLKSAQVKLRALGGGL